jgi:hypothetical protein
MFTDGVKLLAAAEKMGLERVVSKQRETVWQPLWPGEGEDPGVARGQPRAMASADEAWEARGGHLGAAAQLLPVVVDLLSQCAVSPQNT